jgi:4-hydroxy-tetrahydrodipicolinate synthase
MSDAVLASGLWSVLPTPFRHGEVDPDSLRRLIAELSALDGLRGLVALGVFGESATLTPAERALVVRTVCAANPGRGLVIGVTGTETEAVTRSAAELVEIAGGAATAVMIQVNSADPEVLRSHLRTVQAACATPVVVQDYPVITGVTISSAQLAKAVAGLDFIAAVKSESPPTGAVIAELTAAVDVPVFGGLGGVGLLDELLAGAAGAMTGFSFPEAIAATLTAWRDGGFAAARAAYAPWLPLVNFEGQPQVGLAIRKQLLARRGRLDDPAVRPPARSFPAELEPVLQAHWETRPAAPEATAASVVAPTDEGV